MYLIKACYFSYVLFFALKIDRKARPIHANNADFPRCEDDNMTCPVVKFLSCAES